MPPLYSGERGWIEKPRVPAPLTEGEAAYVASRNLIKIAEQMLEGDQFRSTLERFAEKFYELAERKGLEHKLPLRWSPPEFEGIPKHSGEES